MSLNKIPASSYAFNAGPLPERELSDEITAGNCRLLLQLYFYKFYGKYFSKDLLLNPEAYTSTGEFIRDCYAEDFFENLPNSTVIYAQRLLDRDDNPVDHSPAAFANYEDYIIRLHSALYISDVNQLIDNTPSDMPIDDTVQPGSPVILHATYIQGSTCVWSVAKFLHYYQPIAAKSFIDETDY